MVPLFSLVDVFQSIVDLPEFRGQEGKISAGICSDLLAAVNTGIFLDVRGDVLRDCVVVSE